MDYSTYGYHDSKHITKPRKSSGNIKGIELEISDYDSGYLLDELIAEDILTAPSNEHRDKEYTISIEDDGSVYKELIFKASCNSTLLKGVKKLSERLHGNITNGHGTSCHIHINNAYFQALGLTRKDIVKSAEFLAPILYRISGRDESSYFDWAPSAIHTNIEDTDLFKRVNPIETSLTTNNGKYSLVNTGPFHTTEIRIFSNYYNFDYDYIKMYLETVDFIIELAKFMKGKSYIDEYDKIFQLTKNFFEKRRYTRIYVEQSLGDFFLNEEERKKQRLEQKLRFFKEKMRELKGMWSTNNNENCIILLRTLRRFDETYGLDCDIKFNINEINLEEIENKILEKIENEFELLE